MNNIRSKFLLNTRASIYKILYIVDQLIGNESRIVIFCYHSISTDSWKYSVSKKMFRDQIDYMISSGYSPIKLADVLAYSNGKKAIEGKSFVVSFDDGYQNIFNVREYINKKNIKPVVFILADTKNADKAQLGSKYTFLNKSDLSMLMKDGWEIGCHSATHADFFKLTNRSIKREIVESKRDLEKFVGRHVDYFAYP